MAPTDPSQTYDLLVIGSGAGAGTAAFSLADEGWRVAIVDDRPLGGTCALRGCDPKKVLVGIEQARARVRRLESYGLDNTPSLNWKDAMTFKRSFTEPVPASREGQFRDAGIAVFHERAVFLRPHTLRIGEREISARHVLLATGSRPAPLPFPGSELLKTSDEFLELDEFLEVDDLPERIAFVGGGYISMEFAFLAREAGARVDVFHRGKHVLQGFEPDITDLLVRHARNEGIGLHLETPVKAIEFGKDGFTVVGRGPDGDEMRLTADLVFHGAGRVPNVDGIGLEAAGIQYTAGGVAVNNYLQSTTQPHVYAAGDCADSAGLPLTPVGGRESLIAAENLLHGNRRKANYAGTPTVAFSQPPVAAVGLTEEEARSKGHDMDVKTGNMSEWNSLRRLRSETGAFKVLISRSDDRILGAHLIGPGSDEIINLFGLAIREGLKRDALKKMLYAYPTQASNVPYML